MSDKIKLTSRIFLLLIMFIGLLVRFFSLTAQGLWLPEVKVVCFSQRVLTGMFNYTDAYRPLYLLLGKVWMNIFGTSEASVRMLPILIGVGSVLLIFYVGKKLWNERAGLISAFILSLSVFHVYFSRQGKGDSSLIVFLILCSFLIMLKIIEKDKWTTHILNIFTHILILMTHPFGIFWLLTQNACFLILNKSRNTKNWIMAMVFLSLALIPWYIFVVGFDPERDAGNFFRPSLAIFPQLLEVFSCGGMRLVGGGESYAMSPERMSAAWLLTLVYVAIFFLEIFSKVKTLDTSGEKPVAGKLNTKMALLAWLVLPPVLIFLYSVTIRPIYWPRYVIYASPAYYLLIGNFLARIQIRKRAVILILIGVLSLLALKNVYYPERAGGFREGLSFFKENLQPGDTIVISPAEMMGVAWYYWQSQDHGMLKQIDDEKGFLINGKWETDFVFQGYRVICLQFNRISRFNEDSDFGDLKLGQSRIWLLYCPNWTLNENSRFLEMFLMQQYNLRAEMFFPHDVFWVKCFEPITGS